MPIFHKLIRFFRVLNEKSITFCQGFVNSVWCHSWVLWQSPDTPIMSCFMCICLLFYVRLFSHLRLVCVGAWCLDSGTHVLSFGLVSGFGHSRSTFCLVVWVCGLGRALFCPRVLCCTQFVFLSAACIHVMSCAVCHAACVFNWLGAFMLSCLVRVLSCIRTRGLWVLSFCTWLVICLLAMCLCFCFFVSTWFCLSFLCAMCSHVNLSWPHPSG